MTSLVEITRWKQAIRNIRYGLLNASMSQNTLDSTIMKSLTMLLLRLLTDAGKTGISIGHLTALSVLPSLPSLAQELIWIMEIAVLGLLLSMLCLKATGLSLLSILISTVMMTIARLRASAMQWKHTTLLVSRKTTNQESSVKIMEKKSELDNLTYVKFKYFSTIVSLIFWSKNLNNF